MKRPAAGPETGMRGKSLCSKGFPGPGGFSVTGGKHAGKAPLQKSAALEKLHSRKALLRKSYTSEELHSGSSNAEGHCTGFRAGKGSASSCCRRFLHHAAHSFRCFGCGIPEKFVHVARFFADVRPQILALLRGEQQCDDCTDGSSRDEPYHDTFRTPTSIPFSCLAFQKTPFPPATNGNTIRRGLVLQFSPGCMESICRTKARR